MEIEEIIIDNYKSISALSKGIYKDNGSKFLAFAYPVESETEIKQIISELKKEYYDARHHCYAYCLGYKADVWRVNDDGEPSSTAGKPIFGQINSAGLSDILIVVVRYFGGIKLGVPGLIKAYKSATADAIANADIIEKIAAENYTINFGYLQMNAVMKIIKDLSLPQKDQDFGSSCSLTVRVRLSQEDKFKELIDDIDGANYIIMTSNNT